MKVFSGLVLVTGVTVLAIALGCAQMVATPPAPAVKKLPNLFQLDFSSQLPELVYVTHGPIDSHQRYRVNDLLKMRLEERLAARSSVDSGDKVTVMVRVLELKFDYEEIGGGNQSSSLPFVSFRELLLLGGFSGLQDDTGGFNIPSETVRTAVISLQLSLRSGTQDYGRHEISESFVEKIMWEDQYAALPFDHSTFDYVVNGVVKTAVGAVDIALERIFSQE